MLVFPKNQTAKLVMRSFTYKIYIRFYYFYDSKHVSDMVALKLPKREFKGLLNFVRERIKHVYGIILLGTALKKISCCSNF